MNQLSPHSAINDLNPIPLAMDPASPNVNLSSIELNAVASLEQNVQL